MLAIDLAAETTPERLRFFLGLRETAGYFARLKDGLEELDFDATSVDLSGHPFGYASRGWWERAARWLAHRRNSSTGLMRAFWRTLQTALAIAVVLWAIPRHDVFVLASLPPAAALLTIGALRLSRKRVIVLFTGSDSRPPYLDGFVSYIGTDARSLARVTSRRHRSVAAMTKWADVVISHSASSHFLDRPFVSFVRVGIPSPKPKAGRDYDARPSIRIVHGPSHPYSKGTMEIGRAISALKDEGLPLEFIELLGVSHEQLMAELDRADLVVDQLYSDQPMPGLATEAASSGLPVVIGGYDWSEIRRGESSTPWPPTIQIHPDELLNTLRILAVDARARAVAGRQAQDFIVKEWTARAVAERYVRLATGDCPASWLSSPSDIQATHGYGLPHNESRRRISALVAHSGVRSLRLSAWPHLERRILARLDIGGDA